MGARVTRVVGVDSFPISHEIWEKILDADLRQWATARTEDTTVSNLCSLLEENDGETRNFSRLIRHTIQSALAIGELDPSISQKQYLAIQRSCNGFLLARIFVKFLLDRAPIEVVLRYVEPNSPRGVTSMEMMMSPGVHDEKEPLLAQLLSSLSMVICLPVRTETIEAIREGLLLIVVFASPQLYTTVLTRNALISPLADDRNLTNALLALVATKHQPHEPVKPKGIIGDLADVFMWSSARVPEENVDIGLIRTAMCALMCILCQLPNNSSINIDPSAMTSISRDEAYRDTATHFAARLDTEAAEILAIIISLIQFEEARLFLLLQLNSNHDFCEHLFACVDEIEPLLLPLLDSLQLAEQVDGCHTLLAILLAITADEGVSRRLFQLQAQSDGDVQSDSDRSSSLGDLVFAVVLRVLVMNIKNWKNKPVHDVAVSVLANLSFFVDDLNAASCHRIINLLSSLWRQRSKYTQMEVPDDAMISAIENILADMIAIVSSCLSHRAKHNAHLVYAILMDRSLFVSLSNIPKLGIGLEDVFTLVSYFEKRLESLMHAQHNLSIEAVQAMIHEGLRQFPDDYIKKGDYVRFGLSLHGNRIIARLILPHLWTVILSILPLHSNASVLLLLVS